jgi:hypothetical protein
LLIPEEDVVVVQPWRDEMSQLEGVRGRLG